MNDALADKALNDGRRHFQLSLSIFSVSIVDGCASLLKLRTHGGPEIPVVHTLLGVLFNTFDGTFVISQFRLRDLVLLSARF